MPRTPHPLASVEQIYSPPSRQDGVPAELESDLRVAGCMLIQEAGVMLSLPQSTMATAQVVFHRFFYVSSMMSFGVYVSCPELTELTAGSQRRVPLPRDEAE